MLSCLLVLVFLVCICLSSVVSVEDSGNESKPRLSDTLDEELSNLTTATLINILQQQGVDIGDNYFSKDELKRLIKMSIDRDEEQERRESGGDTTEVPTRAGEQFKPEEASPGAVRAKADPSVWQQVKDQFRSDVAPFLALIPSPVKTYVQKELSQVGKMLNLTLRGAVSPMLLTAAKLLDKAAQLLVHLAEKLKTRNQELKHAKV